MPGLCRKRCVRVLAFAAASVLAMGASGLAGAMAYRSERVRRTLVDAAVDLGLRNPPPPPPPALLDAGVPGAVSRNHPDFLVRPGYDVEQVAGGLTFPVGLAFPLEPGDQPDDVLVYVTELHHGVKYISRDGEVHDYSGGRLPFVTNPHWRVYEAGFVGLAPIPGTEDLVLTASFVDDDTGRPRNHILRLVSEPGGRRLARVDTILRIDELTAPGHNIGIPRIRPDGTLMVGVGDGFDWTRAQDLQRWGGKILRMNLDGTACADNPFYDPHAPDSPRSYTYAYGLRNPFDHATHPDTGDLYSTDVGTILDRLVLVQPGHNYAWNGTNESLRTNALYVWPQGTQLSPGGVSLLSDQVLRYSDGGTLAVAGFGPTAVRRCEYAKSIEQFRVDPVKRTVTGPPAALVRYVGPTHATVLGLAEGPDGLYFTDFFGRHAAEYPKGPLPEGFDGQSQYTGKASVWKVVTSEQTLHSRAGAGAVTAMGEQLTRTTCAACHMVDGAGGLQGPELTHAYRRLDERLNNPAYDVALQRMLADSTGKFAEHRDRLRDVQAAEGDARIRRWLHHHLEAPRFDHPDAQMPAFNLLPREQREAIIAHLMTRR